MTTDNNLGRASIPAVNQYLQLAIAQDLIIDDILQELSLNQALLNDNSQSISGVTFQRLIAALINLSNDNLFGLHTAQFVQPVSYSVLGFITMNCQTLGEAITKIVPFEKLVGDMGTTTITQQSDYVSIAWSCLFTEPLVRRHMIDNCLASWLTFAKYLSNNNSKPIQVLLTRKQPDLQQCAQYQDLFNCSVVFNQTSDAIIFDKSLLSLPLDKGNKQLLSTLESHATEQINSLSQEQNIISKTTTLIKQNLVNGQITQQAIAQQLNISSKTLQRQLLVKKTKFKQLVDQVRLNIATELLTSSALNLTQISSQLGFSEPRSFFRWFQNLQHITPGDFRKKAR